MNNAPRRAYGLRMSCTLALIVLFFFAIGVASVGWHAKTAYDYHCAYRNAQLQLEAMRIMYQSRPMTITIQKDETPEPKPMPEKSEDGSPDLSPSNHPCSFQKPDCGPQG